MRIPALQDLGAAGLRDAFQFTAAEVDRFSHFTGDTKVNDFSDTVHAAVNVVLCVDSFHHFGDHALVGDAENEDR